ncbi:MAG: endonuclease/exonuclease/phosphatase family protein [Chloroflexaceae bacterium]|jgi:endonuclease/exonuclease/phosphatase (EEP) superfamily protein YafD|nr:endonuclease/exonuclease/phosphatase family protein [Chloroflexaceae bacterium]
MVATRFQPVIQFLQRCVEVGALLYGLVMLGLALFWLVRPTQSGLMEVSNIFAIWLFAPLIVLLPLALLLRSLVLRGVVAVLLLLFGLSFAGQLLPRGTAASNERPALRLLTFNVLYGNDNADAVIAAIRAQNPDVVGMQELSGLVADAIQAELAAEYPYQFLQPAAFDQGMGIISRYPLRATSRHPNGAWQQATLDMRGTPVTLLNVHLEAPHVDLGWSDGWLRLPEVRTYDATQREWEAGQLFQLVDGTAGPLVLLGDFNLSDREPLYHAFDARLHDSFRETSWGPGYTFPNQPQRFSGLPTPLPLVRIDYIWSGGGLSPTHARVSCAGSSDHCLVVADLVFASP